MYCSSNCAPDFLYCTFSGNAANNLDQFGGGIYCYEWCSFELTSTIIAFSTGSGIHFGADCQCPEGCVEHSDFWDNTPAHFTGNVPDDLGEIDRVNANGDDCDRFFNIFLNPLFVDPLFGDMHLANGSPCIGAAELLDPPVNEDFDGEPRPNPPGSLPDIGMDESLESGLCLPPDALTTIVVPGGVRLTWQPSGNCDCYRIYRSTDPFAPFPAGWGQGGCVWDQTTWDDDAIAGAQKYFYRVTAVYSCP